MVYASIYQPCGYFKNLTAHYNPNTQQAECHVFIKVKPTMTVDIRTDKDCATSDPWCLRFYFPCTGEVVKANARVETPGGLATVRMRFIPDSNPPRNIDWRNYVQGTTISLGQNNTLVLTDNVSGSDWSEFYSGDLVIQKIIGSSGSLCGLSPHNTNSGWVLLQVLNSSGLYAGNDIDEIKFTIDYYWKVDQDTFNQTLSNIVTDSHGDPVLPFGSISEIHPTCVYKTSTLTGSGTSQKSCSQILSHSSNGSNSSGSTDSGGPGQDSNTDNTTDIRYNVITSPDFLQFSDGTVISNVHSLDLMFSRIDSKGKGSAYYLLQGQGHTNEISTWKLCFDDPLRIKIFIPPDWNSYVTLGSTTSNSKMAVFYKWVFIPIDSQTFSENCINWLDCSISTPESLSKPVQGIAAISNPKIIFPFNDGFKQKFSNELGNFKGGWLYLHIAGGFNAILSYTLPGEFLNERDYDIPISVTYEKKSLSWSRLKSVIPFGRNRLPIDGFDQICEISDFCKFKNKRLIIYGTDVGQTQENNDSGTSPTDDTITYQHTMSDEYYFNISESLCSDILRKNPTFNFMISADISLNSTYHFEETDNLLKFYNFKRLRVFIPQGFRVTLEFSEILDVVQFVVFPEDQTSKVIEIDWSIKSGNEVVDSMNSDFQQGYHKVVYRNTKKVRLPSFSKSVWVYFTFSFTPSRIEQLKDKTVRINSLYSFFTELGYSTDFPVCADTYNPIDPFQQYIEKFTWINGSVVIGKYLPKTCESIQYSRLLSSSTTTGSGENLNEDSQHDSTTTENTPDNSEYTDSAVQSTYVSLHQFKDTRGNISFKNQFLNASNEVILSSPDLKYDPRFRIYPCDGQSNCYEWCAQDWMRYRLYIPTGLVNSVNILISARQPNASLYAMVYFIPDGSTVETVDFNNYKNQYIVSGWNTIDVGERYLLQGYTPVLYKVENIKRIKLDNISSYTDKSGWLYISLAQSDLVMNSWDGYQPDTKIKISVEYKLSQNIDIQEYFRLRKFTNTGDPEEAFRSLLEKNKKCSQNEEIIFGSKGSNEPNQESGNEISTYKSIHQYPESGPKGFKNQIKTVIGNPFADVYRIISEYSGEEVQCLEDNCLTSPFTLHKRWCSNTWYRYRAFLVEGIKNTVSIGVTANSTFLAMVYFAPYNSQPRPVDFRNFKQFYDETRKNQNQRYPQDFENSEEMYQYLLQGYNVLAIPVFIKEGLVFSKEISKSGWLYISINQASQIWPSYQGHLNSVKPTIEVLYHNDNYTEDFIDSILRRYQYDNHGDPIESFSSLTEYNRSCNTQNLVIISGSGSGNSGGSEFTDSSGGYNTSQSGGGITLKDQLAGGDLSKVFPCNSDQPPYVNVQCKK